MGVFEGRGGGEEIWVGYDHQEIIVLTASFGENHSRRYVCSKIDVPVFFDVVLSEKTLKKCVCSYRSSSRER